MKKGLLLRSLIQRDSAVEQAKEYFQMIVDLQKENQRLIEQERQLQVLRQQYDSLVERGVRENRTNHQLMDELGEVRNVLKERGREIDKLRQIIKKYEENAITGEEQIGVLNDEILYLKARIDELLKRSDMTSEKWTYVEMAVANGNLYRLSAVKMVMAITGMSLAAAVKAWEDQYKGSYFSLEKEFSELDLNTMVSIMDGES